MYIKEKILYKTEKTNVQELSWFLKAPWNIRRVLVEV